MAFTPISNAVIQYSKNASGASASDYYLKLYAASTSTPISMYSLADGSGALAKCQINSLGFPVNGSDAVFIPYIDQKYRMVLYTSSTDADANTFANAVFDIDDVPQQSINQSEYIKNFPTLALAVASTTIENGDVLNIKGRTCSDGSGTFWDVVLSSTVTENAYNIVQGTGVGTLSLVLRQQGSAFDYMTQAEIDDVSNFSRTLDVTTAVQTFIDDVGNGTGHFPNGRYQVTTIEFGKNVGGGVFTNGNVAFEGIASTATDAVVTMSRNDIKIYGVLYINGNANVNYTAGFKLHTPYVATQYCQIQTLKIQYCRIGIWQGDLTEPTPTFSENWINHYSTLGVEIAIYSERGILFINGGAFGPLIGDWNTRNPGDPWDNTRCRVIKQIGGSINCSNCQAIMTAITNGIGFELSNNSFSWVGGAWEIASPNMLLEDIDVTITGLNFMSVNVTTSIFLELVDGSTGHIRMSDFRIDSPRLAQGFIQANNTPGWTVDLSNVKIDQASKLLLVKSSGADNTYTTDIRYKNFRILDSSLGNYVFDMADSNLLDTVPNTSTADLKNLWWKDATEAGTESVDTGDVPTITGRAPPYSIQMDGTGTAGTLWSMDRTSSATILNTGIRTAPGEMYQIEGWFKHAGAGTSALRVLLADSALTLTTADVISSTGLITTTWAYIRALYEISDATEYIGIGCKATDSIVNFMDLKISRISK